MSAHKKDIAVCRDMLVVLEKHKGKIEALDVLLETLSKVLDERVEMTPDSEIKKVLERLREIERGYFGAAAVLEAMGKRHDASRYALLGAARGIERAEHELRNWDGVPF